MKKLMTVCVAVAVLGWVYSVSAAGNCGKGESGVTKGCPQKAAAAAAEDKAACAAAEAKGAKAEAACAACPKAGTCDAKACPEACCKAAGKCAEKGCAEACAKAAAKGEAAAAEQKAEGVKGCGAAKGACGAAK
ncbi:MAG: hypothetical protein JXR77_07565 [Lentisphaeria bacterium]|nr:hypothetical protein [Lentisphaeria bacterium]